MAPTTPSPAATTAQPWSAEENEGEETEATAMQMPTTTTTSASNAAACTPAYGNADRFPSSSATTIPCPAGVCSKIKEFEDLKARKQELTLQEFNLEIGNLEKAETNYLKEHLKNREKFRKDAEEMVNLRSSVRLGPDILDETAESHEELI
ncbi:unnamed protein product [Caenorhabditis brenneri]